MTNKEILQTIQALRDCARREAEDCPFTAVAGCDGCDGCQKVSAGRDFYGGQALGLQMERAGIPPERQGDEAPL